VYKFGCANCHPYTVASHIDGSVEVDVTANAAGGHLKNLNGTGGTPATFNGSKQCLNVYCHSNGYKPAASYTFATTPVWGAALAGDKCAACHGNSPNSTIVGSSAHAAHVVGIHVEDIFNGVSRKLPIGGGIPVNAAHGRNNRSTTINCNICHFATVTSSANDKNFYCSGCHDGATPPGGFKNIVYPLNVNTVSHVNGKVDVSFINQKIATKAQVATSAFAGYTAANQVAGHVTVII
jgi:predicted CxxxxCH...CXXCH cytochrome family protein